MRSVFFALALCLSVSARPRLLRRDAVALQNGQDALAQNAEFQTLTADSTCTTGEDACVTGKFAQCVGGKFVLQACAPTTSCFALPNVNSAGTSIACTTQADFDSRIAATGASVTTSSVASAPPTETSSAAGSTSTDTGSNNAGGGAAAGNDPQTSLTLDPSVIATGFADDGQSPPVAGQTASLTSKNNFINFCLTVPNLPITNGLQITTGSCNPAPIGSIPSVNNMPSAKFTFPTNGGTVTANQAFTINMAISNLDAGHFTNAQKNYFAAPQQLNSQGTIIGHTHVVAELLSGLDQTTPTNPNVFAFFKGIDGAAVNGIVSANVTAGLPAGAYRLCSINSSSNHQPAIVPIAQHGSLDDCVYFTSQ